MSAFRRTVGARAAIEAAQARTLREESLPARLRFSTDTRTLEPGDVFVALHGERFDGNAYVREACARGAAAVVVTDPAVVPGAVPALIVEDTTRAYLRFAAAARAEVPVRVAAITGSAGKTTTKALLAQLLERTLAGRVVATPANENNEIGVAQLLLGLPDDAAFAVVEFGARHYGDIEPLARAARPEVAVLTNVGEAHMEIMGSAERLARTKWDIFVTGARPVLGAADAVSRERAPSLGRPVCWFGAPLGGGAFPGGAADSSVSLERSAGKGDELIVAAGGAAEPARYATQVDLPGEHNRANVAAAAAAALALGAPAAAVAAALPSLALPAGRYERVALGEFEVIFDAYNASPSGTLATLASFAREPAPRRIAVLGSMAELGPGSAALHARVGAAAAGSGLWALLVGGEYASDLARGARDGGLDARRVVSFADNASAVAWLREHARRGDVVLLKASRRYRLEEILSGLRAAHA